MDGLESEVRKNIVVKKSRLAKTMLLLNLGCQLLKKLAQQAEQDLDKSSKHINGTFAGYLKEPSKEVQKLGLWKDQ